MNMPFTTLRNIIFGLIAVSAVSQAQTLRYQGDGFSFSYPAGWKIQKVGKAISLISPEPENQISIKIFALPVKTKQEFFAEYGSFVAGGGLGFPTRFESSTEPTIYGNWRGDVIRGTANKNGVDMVISATGIEANSQFYLLQLIAPLDRSWEGQEHRMKLARTLNFRNVPADRPAASGGGDSRGCPGCADAVMRSMERMTSITVNGMK